MSERMVEWSLDWYVVIVINAPTIGDRLQYSRECLGHHRNGTPGIGNYDSVMNVG